MRPFIAFLLVLLAPAIALGTSPLDAGSMTADVTLATTIAFEPDGASPSVTEALARVTWIPYDTMLQDVTDLDTTPRAEFTPDGAIFTWSDPDQQERLAITARVRTINAPVPVRSRIPFPYDDVPPELGLYLAPGGFTDITPGIQRKASELVAGKTDAYEVVFAIADWTTTNVEYSLDSLRAPAIQRASQVLASRQGKCDEITVLFISMVRSVGIPARFVAGYSYTEDQRFDDVWGAHGWAEVWYPGVGWVPYDVTYGEYGYLDAGHIAMAYSPDANETSVTFEARGHDFDLRTRPLDVTITPTDLRPRGDSGVRIALDAPRTRVGFGSAVLILATVTNERNAYVSTRLDLARTSDSDALSDTSANVLLRPGETRTVSFLVRIEDDLKPGYRYEFPFVVYDRLGTRSEVTIDVTPDGPVYSEEDFTGYLTVPEHTTIAPFSVACDQGNVQYPNEPVTHRCTLEDAAADEIAVCRGRACETIPIVDDAFTITITPTRAGVSTQQYTARVGGLSAPFYVTTRAVDPTVLALATSAPAQVRFDDVFTLRANLSATGSAPQDLIITLDAGISDATQTLPRLRGTALLSFDVPARVLRAGENELTITVAYKDEVGASREETWTVPIELVEVTFGQRVLLWLGAAQGWLEDLFS